MAFENATSSIFIYSKLVPQPSSEAANGLTAQIVSGFTNGEEKSKIYRQCFPNNFILRRAARELKEQEQILVPDCLCQDLPSLDFQLNEFHT